MRKKRTPEQHREAFRKFARKVVDISDPAFLATEINRAREGKMSPQEKAKYIEAAYHFDVEEKPVPPAITIQVLQAFSDGKKDDKAIVIGPEPQK